MTTAPDGWTEPGRSVTDDGRIVYAWPSQGRFAALWERLHEVFSDDEKHDLLALLLCWRDENSMLRSFTDDAGGWVDVNWDWDQPNRWTDQR